MKIDIKRIVAEHKNNIIVGVLSFVVVCFVVALLNSLSYNVAVVDVQSVVAKSSQVAVLKQEQEQKTMVLHKWIEDAKKDVEKQKNKEKKEELLNKYNKEFAEKQQALTADYIQKLKVIDENITNIIEKEAKRMGYDMVASKGVVLYGADDITEEVAKNIQ